MSTIEKFVSPFIPQQFPSFYKEEGPNFIAFVKAYYEWMESTNQALQRSRSLLEYADIDTTEQEFLKYFRSTYLHSLPESIIADKRLLVKHILDLYRAKGTPRAYELLFRLIFNEDIELYIPSDFIFKPSDGEWTVPRYIEVSDSDYLEDLIGKQIYNSSRNATAVVESVNQKVVNKRLFHVLTLSSIKGRFKFGEKILCASVPEITLTNAPNVIGSLTAIAIENGGLGFTAGDIVDVTGDGVDAKARIAAVRDENGKVNFRLENGGSGYSLDGTVITVATALNLIIENPSGTFSNGNIITSSNTSANGTLVSSNSSLLKLIDFSPSLTFYPGDTVTNGSGGSAVVTRVTGGGGSGASFAIGGLVNKEVMLINTDRISEQASIPLNNPWNFGKYAEANLTSTIVETLNIINREVGTISFLSRINPGTGYSASPFVSVIEPIVSAQAIDDGFGGLKGLNADISTSVANSRGIATAVEVINSGFGFQPGEKVFLSSPNNAGVVVTGISVIDTDGVGDGYWKNNKGFVSDIMNIQDSYYYQNFSYEILVNRMLSVYEKIVKDLIHPSGVALFGRFRLKNQMLGEPSEPKFFDLEPSAAAPPTPIDLITLSSYNTLTLNRNSPAAYLRSTDNALVKVGSNVARFDPTRGMLLEGQRTNSIRNPGAEGAVVGSPGTDPTNWARGQVNCTSQITATGETNGIFWVEYFVTATGVGDWRVNFEGSAGPPSFPITPGSFWSASAAVAHTAALPAQVTQTSIRSPNSALPIVAISVPTDGVPRVREASFVGNATVASTPLAYYVQFNGACTFSVRVGLPTMENNASFVSSPTLPPIGTIAAFTRLTDQLSSPISTLGIPSNGPCTMVGEFRLTALSGVGYSPNLMEMNAGSLNDRIWAYITGRRNLLTFTEQFDNAVWTKANVTVTANSAIAPDGTTTADAWTTLGSQYPSVFRGIAVDSGVTHTFSIFAKVGSLSTLSLEFRGATSSPNATFNLSTGVVSSGSGVIQNVGNGWYRCSVTITSVDNSELVIIGAGAGVIPAGDILIWGAQLERGLIATPYQRVVTASDVSEGGVSIDAVNGTLLLARTTAGVTSFTSLGGGITVNTPFRVAMTHDGGGRIAGSLNNGTVQTLTGAPTTYTTMRVGSGFGGDQPVFGYQRGFSYLNYAVDDVRLRQLSTLT